MEVGNRGIREHESEQLSKHMSVYKEIQLKHPVRTAPLGKDRYGNIYYKLAGDTSKLFIEYKNCTWGYYTTLNDYDKLLKYLNINGIKENILKNNLQNIKWTFNEQKQPNKEPPKQPIGVTLVNNEERFPSYSYISLLEYANSNFNACKILAAECSAEPSSAWIRCVVCQGKKIYNWKIII
jgi:hypothetical protein